MVNKMITNTEEWGNIELPGLSDKELFQKNWNLSQVGKEKWQDSEYRKAMTKKRQDKARDPEYRAKYLAAMEELNKDPEYRAKYLAAMEKLKHNEEWRKNQKAASDKFRNDPEFKEKKRQEMLANKKNDEYESKRKAGVREAYKNPALRQKLKEMRQHQKKKIQTPDGIFDSRKAAAEFYAIHPTQINSRIKKWPDKYFYIKNKDF